MLNLFLFCLRFELALGSRSDEIEELRGKIHTLSFHEAQERLAALAASATKNKAYPQDKIEHFVVLYHENHVFDHMLGCLADSMPEVDGIPQSGRKIYADPNDPSQGFLNISCGKAEYICPEGPSYSLFAGKFANGTDSQCRYFPYDEQSDDYSFQNIGDNINTTTEMLGPEQLPIKTAIAQEFGIFNRLYTAVPTSSMPNHMFTQTGTSCGTKNAIFPWSSCGGSQLLYPQWTIYDQMKVDGIEFGIYFEAKPKTIEPPDAYMTGVLRALSEWRLFDQFKIQAKNGQLPAFSWVIPNHISTDHPCNDIRLGEAVQKEVYEVLRASEKWNSTLFFIVYDDGGGYYDHVVPPFQDVPADGAACSQNITECSDPFDFRRLGLRSTALLASPWIPKGKVFQEPTQGKYNSSQFDLTSVISTVRDLFGLSSNLTARDDWSASFLELLTETQPRTDTPETLPDAPTTNKENEDQQSPAQHCSALDGICRGIDALTNKQKRNIPLFAHLTGRPVPDLTQLDKSAANEWLLEHIRLLMISGVHQSVSSAGASEIKATAV